MAKRKGPWSFKVQKRNFEGTSIALVFKSNDGAKRELFSEWYPPWQNDLMRDNAKCMVDDLNKAFAERLEAKNPNPTPPPYAASGGDHEPRNEGGEDGEVQKETSRDKCRTMVPAR